MNVRVHPTPRQATLAAADFLAGALRTARTLMVAGGNTPLELYAEIARRHLPLKALHVFVLDEYVGVPPEDPRTCTNLLRQAVAQAWNIPEEQFHGLSSTPAEAKASLDTHERAIKSRGGIDAIVLGLGPNAHLGFNEPGSARDSQDRVLDLEASSVEANRLWFGGEHAPSRGATVGLSTVLAARTAILLAFGRAKAAAVRAMVEGPREASCPAAWLQDHPDASIFLDEDAASLLARRGRTDRDPA